MLEGGETTIVVRRGYVALDIEATCLNARKCQLVSAVALPFSDKGIDLSRAVYFVEPPRGNAGTSALIHGIVRSTIGIGSFYDIIEAIKKRILIVYGRHDVEFIVEEAKRRDISIGEMCYVDVLSWILSIPCWQEEARKRGRFTLEDALEVILGIVLPRRRFHDPLSDAVHVALLFVHLTNRLGKPPVKCAKSNRSSIIHAFRHFTKKIIMKPF
ncbi:hypothetical protein Pyrde_1721 [Pyrodictium delaneyi]|uniref:Exonuclease domain-containing protein n=1 Tax=Pyrodictium delaneyi TaxID=1273541 RepID=A0A0P0N566_9CREN|nr:hypothetical protein Pyrde_1721 [Pyrodictium delaneyi]